MNRDVTDIPGQDHPIAVKLAVRFAFDLHALDALAFGVAEAKPDFLGRIALRTFEKRPDGRVRFAHTSPVHVDIPDRPLRPRREEVAYFIERIEQEIERNRSVLPENALAEYGQALGAYQQIMKTAR